MTPCPFTASIASYAGPLPPLRKHVKQCQDCKVAQALIYSQYESNPQSDACLDEVTLAAFSESLLVDSEQALADTHVRSCSHCQMLLDASPGDEEETLRSKAALREGDAYVLAKDIATWLVDEKYPRESIKVSAAFDAAYKDSWVEETNLERGVSSLALGFSGARGIPLFQRIIKACLLVGLVRLEMGSNGSTLSQLYRAACIDVPEGSRKIVDEVATRLDEMPD